MIERLRGRKWMKIRAEIRREQPLCPRCKESGRVRGWEEVDHIVSLSDGGTNDRSNLVGLCKDHHRNKTNRDRGFKGKITFNEHGMPLDHDHPWNK